MIDDDEYIELAHILSEKIRTRRKKPEFVDKNYKRFVEQAEGLKNSPWPNSVATNLEVIEAVKKLYKKYVE
jgi:hypothetical protein